jgi:UDP-glucuronate decarboxylase
MSVNDGRVVSNFIVQALGNEDITIYGDGTQTRSFCFVSDLVTGIVKLMNASSNLVGPMNLGNPTEFTILELATTIIEMTDSKSKVIFKPLPLDDPKQRKPDISLAQSTIDWNPQVNLEIGLKKTIEYFK